MNLKGKKISILGDSLSTYCGLSGNGRADVPQPFYGYPFFADETYWMRVIKRFELDLLVNDSYSGGLLSCDIGNCIAGVNRVSNLAANGEKPDIILIFMGLNDIALFVPAESFGQAYAKTLSTVSSLYPKAEVFCVGMPDRSPVTNLAARDYNGEILAAVKGAGSKFHFVELFNSALSGEAYKNNSVDGLHLNADGMELLADIIIGEMAATFNVPKQPAHRIFVTGDTHGGDVERLHILAQKYPALTKEDFVIIAGDFGAIWSEKDVEECLKVFTGFPFTVLFVDGNHENFDMLNAYPVEEWHGGAVHRIKPDIIHLMRGQVYEIYGRKFFTFGGATSIDRDWRIPGVSWWPQELPTEEELEQAAKNLKAHGNEVDYIITHSCGLKALEYPPLPSRSFQTELYPENYILSYFEDCIKFRHWYFGHYHTDAYLSDKYSALYRKVIEI